MPFALNDRGKLLVSLGRSAEGISDLDRAVAMAYDDIRDSLRVDRSWCLAVCGDYGQASADVRAALKDLEINCPSTFLAKPFFVGALTYARSVRLVLEDESLVQTERERLANEYTNEAVLLLTRCLAMGHKTKEELLLDPELEPIRASIPDSIIEPQDRRSESSPPPDKLEPVHAEP